MIHVILLIYLLIVSLGITVVVITLLLARKYRSRLYIYTGLAFLGAVFNLLVCVIDLYRFTTTGSPVIKFGLYSFSLTGLSAFLMLYFLPVLSHQVTGIPFRIPKRIVHILLLSGIFFTLVIELIYQLRIALYFRDFFFALIFIYSAFIILFYHNKIVNSKLRSASKAYSILIFSVVPAILLYNTIVLYFYPNNIYLKQPYFNVLFLAVSIVLALWFGARYFFNNKESIEIGTLAERAKYFNFSKREIQIVRLLVQGLSNREIAEHLYISQKTVKNHVYNIFRKINVKNRVQLINVLASRS